VVLAVVAAIVIVAGTSLHGATGDHRATTRLFRITLSSRRQKLLQQFSGRRRTRLLVLKSLLPIRK